MNASRILLLNGTRPNLIAHPEAFDNAAWTATSATVTANATVAPNGTTTADKLIAAAALTQHRINYTPVSAAGSQTFSCHMKAGEYAYAQLRIGTAGGFLLSLADGVVTNAPPVGTCAVKDAGNGWFRFAISLAGAANDVVRINVYTGGALVDFTGDGTSGIYIWGAKLEQAATASRYKPV
jgi:hypothetical protein